jgi:hypothetical protein
MEYDLWKVGKRRKDLKVERLKAAKLLNVIAGYT